MLVKELLLDSILHEVEVVKFLAGKVPPDGADYRPSPGQRSTLELLQYLSMCAHRVAVVVLSQDWELRDEFKAEAARLTLEEIPDAMDRHAERLRELFASISDDDFATKEVELPWGPKTTVAGMFLNATLKFLVAYRMQLFLYLKGMGQTGLGTVECWLGREPEDA